MDNQIEFVRVFRNTSRSERKIVPATLIGGQLNNREKQKQRPAIRNHKARNTKNNEKQKDHQRQKNQQRQKNNERTANNHRQRNHQRIRHNQNAHNRRTEINNQTINQSQYEQSHQNILNIPPAPRNPKIKLQDAQLINHKNQKCTLLIADQLMDKATANRYLRKLGKDHFGLYVLKQPLRSSLDMTRNEIMSTTDYKNIIKSIGLHLGRTYNKQNMTQLRYKRVCIIVNEESAHSMEVLNTLSLFFESLWPSLFYHFGFVKELYLKYSDEQRNVKYYLQNVENTVPTKRFKKNKKHSSKSKDQKDQKVYFIHPQYKQIELNQNAIVIQDGQEDLFQENSYQYYCQGTQRSVNLSKLPAIQPLPALQNPTISQFTLQPQPQRLTKYRKINEERQKQKELIKKIQQSTKGVVSQPNFVPPAFTINHVQRKRFPAGSFQKLSKQKIKQIQLNLQQQEARAQKQRQYEQLPDQQKYISID